MVPLVNLSLEAPSGAARVLMEMADLNDEWACLSGGDEKLVDQTCVVCSGVGKPNAKIGALVTALTIDQGE